MRLGKLSLALFVVLGVGGILGWRALSQPVDKTTPAVTEAQIGTVKQTVLASGTLEAAQLVSVGARVSGQIETLAVTLGQEVKAGDLIARIDSQDQQNDVQMSEADLKNIDAQIAAKKAEIYRAEQIYARQKKLNAQNYAAMEALQTAAADVEIYKANLESLKAQRSAAEVTLSTARIALERTQITAPIDGTIVAIIVKQGQTVNANTDAPTIVKLADLSTMLVKTEISEADIMRVGVGQKASFTTLGAPEKVFQATLRDIEPAPTEIKDSDTIDSESAIYYNGLLEVSNPDGVLRIGMTAQVTIELASADDVITVPSSAVHRDESGAYVTVFDTASGTAIRRNIETGLDNKVDAEIISGLERGESVVTGAALVTKSDASGMNRPPMRF